MDKELMALSLEEKVEKSKEIIKEAVERFGEKHTAVAWTSGKDSTLLLSLVRDSFDGQVPIPVMFVDTGKHFDEVYKMRDRLAKDWKLKIIVAKNIEVINATENGVVDVRKLSKQMKDELKRIGWNEQTFRIALDREPCCHLLKSVATKFAIVNNNLKALIVGIRWDEQESRSNETYFSPRENPKHVRVHPILHFRWSEVWEYIKKNDIPYNPLYDKGYTSIGCFTCTHPNPEGEVERAGRSQDKEEIMARLRSLGYF